jgi:histidinol-phosphate phosphatase family protein
MSIPVVFLDKDGTIVENVPYNVDPRKICFTPNAEKGLKLLHRAGYSFVIVSNQPGIARGIFSPKDMERVCQHIKRLFKNISTVLWDFYYCPHDPKGIVPEYSVVCNCRKPAPGLLLRACRDHDIDLSKSWLIGDILDDIEAGQRAGCKTILMDRGNESEWELASSWRIPNAIVNDLAEAAEIILNKVTII